MKKNYIAPVSDIVKVKIESHLCGNSVEHLRGEASSETVGMSREGGSSWEDEE